MSLDPVLDLDALDLSRRLAAGEISAEALMAATLERIAEVNGAINAIVSLRDADDLLAEARAADAAPRKGWLHGIPMAVKDLVQTAGIRTTMGSPIYAETVPVADEGLARRLRAAGAILIGKTNVPEFGLGSHSINPVFGPTRTPYDVTRSAGGSSGGAGAALAARMVAVADGSDMMGSLRNPAGWNNVYGFRPTWGVVRSDPLGDTFLHPLSTNGAMARSPADIAALLMTLADNDPRLPFGRAPQEYLQGIDADIAGRRIGWLGDWGGALAMEPGILPLVEQALTVFARLGCTVEPVSPPFSADEMWESWRVLRHFAVASRLKPLFDDPGTRALLPPKAIWEIEGGIGLSAFDVQAASEIRSRWFARAATLFDRFDALVLPSAQMWPFPAEWDWPKAIGGVAMDTYHRWMQVVVPASLIGLPAISVPAGFGDQGLPMGMQLIGRAGSDAALLQLAQGYHQATRWTDRKPPF
ncbi:amidase [Tropicimonas sp. IMCC34043]|uniref:amidase n=1 Tax=Tropicimonas sp. IMCC34043 TaxID=2248760 RepID=UPI001E509DB1|nr:amidase [Tropicimonas sp. IMCC34043]